MVEIEELKEKLHENGYISIENLLSREEVKEYIKLTDDILLGNINANKHRHDLGSHAKLKEGHKENICQVMWPSEYMEKDREQSILHRKVVDMARVLLGDDMEFDFDMIISKEPGNLTETPWHQDESYWPDLADKRALSFWCPMVDATVENGCMWFVSGSHETGLRDHRPVAEGHHVKTTDLKAGDVGQPCPVQLGGCTVHTGRTLHFTGGNCTEKPRRVYIINCRPGNMVEEERRQHFDHGLAGLESIEN